MTPTDPRPDPLDPNERELARVVRALPGGEPPAMLDARILKAAQNAVAAAPARRRGPRWLLGGGAAWGIGSAAAAVLAIGISWQVMNPMPSTSLPMPARAPAPASAAAEDSAETTVEFREQAPRRYDNSPPPAEPAATAAMRTRPVPPPSAPPPPPPPPPAPVASAPAPAQSGAINAIEAAGAEDTSILTDEQIARIRQEQAAGAIADRREAEASARAAGDAQEKTEAQAAMAERATASARARNETKGFAGDPGQAEADFQRRPSTWLAHIRALRDRGDDAAARTSLKEFRKRYPDYLVPSDLTLLLEP